MWCADRCPQLNSGLKLDGVAGPMTKALILGLHGGAMFDAQQHVVGGAL